MLKPYKTQFEGLVLMLVFVANPTEQLAAIAEFQGLGPLFKSSEAVQLTEAETEYVVRCVKHTFAQHMVFQFDCTNTLNDQLLQKVSAADTSTPASGFLHPRVRVQGGGYAADTSTPGSGFLHPRVRVQGGGAAGLQESTSLHDGVFRW